MTPADHIAEGTSKVITQYAQKPVFMTYLAVFLNQIQLVENAAADVLDAFTLDNAVGFRLDWVGAKVGQTRIGTTDDVYRRFIRGRISANRSRGSVQDVVKVARAVLDTFTYTQCSTTVAVYTRDILDEQSAASVRELLEQASGPGIQVFLVVEALPPCHLTRVGQENTTSFGKTNSDGSQAVSLTAALSRISA